MDAVNTDAAALGVLERKVLRKIFGSDYRTRTNRQLYELCNDMDSQKSKKDVAKRINIQRFRRLCPVMSFRWMKTLFGDECVGRRSSAKGSTANALERPG